MYNHQLHQQINTVLHNEQIDIGGKDNLFFTRFIANATAIDALFHDIYGRNGRGTEYFDQLIRLIATSYLQRPEQLLKRDAEKEAKGNWFLSNDIAGMSLYVDRFAGNLKGLTAKLDYFQELGVNFLHLMPVFESPEGESDGGYAVSDFRKVDKRFGTFKDLQQLQKKCRKKACT